MTISRPSDVLEPDKSTKPALLIKTWKTETLPTHPKDFLTELENLAKFNLQRFRPCNDRLCKLIDRGKAGEVEVHHLHPGVACRRHYLLHCLQTSQSAATSQDEEGSSAGQLSGSLRKNLLQYFTQNSPQDRRRSWPL